MQMSSCMSSVMKKRALRSLLSYQKKDLLASGWGPANPSFGMTPPFFLYDTHFRILLSVKAVQYNFIVGLIPKLDWWGPACHSFFGYDNDKDLLKARFPMTQLVNCNMFDKWPPTHIQLQSRRSFP